MFKLLAILVGVAALAIVLFIIIVCITYMIKNG